MKNKYYKQSVQRLNFLSQEKIDNMRKNDIMTLGQLSNTKKSVVNEIDFEKSEIDRIFSELQLLDLGIAKIPYRVNSFVRYFLYIYFILSHIQISSKVF